MLFFIALQLESQHQALHTQRFCLAQSMYVPSVPHLYEQTCRHLRHASEWLTGFEPYGNCAGSGRVRGVPRHAPGAPAVKV